LFLKVFILLKMLLKSCVWWPIIGAVGVVGYFAPYTLGVGYNNISSLLSGKLAINLVLGLFLLKFLSWSVSLGSGTSGGTLAPLLTMAVRLVCY
jgi:CIC family chloride channel protein